MNIVEVHKYAIGTKFLYDNREWELVRSPNWGKELFCSTTLNYITEELSLDDLLKADFKLIGYSFKELLEMQEKVNGIIAISLDNIKELPNVYKNKACGYSIDEAIMSLASYFNSKDLAHLLLHSKSFLLK